MTDPRYTDPHKEPLLAPDDGQSGVWGWVAGVAILVLIAFVVIAGWNGERNTASNNASALAERTMSPPSTTGSGGSSPSQPMTPAPAPSSGTQ